MPWVTPTLRVVRETVRNDVSTALSGAVLLGNSVLRVMADAMGGLAHLTLRYIDWLANQLLPDTAEREWLDRHGRIWLSNSDGSRGRKLPAAASGYVSATGTLGTIVPRGTQLTSGTGLFYETTEEKYIGIGETHLPVRALEGGENTNLDYGDTLSFVSDIPGITGSTTVVTMDGGTDEESDDDLRARVLERIQKPPMGGDADDYVAWAKDVPGVTRAWVYPLEMGIGTVTVRFVMDELRKNENGIPDPNDVARVRDYIDIMRPVAVKDFWVVAPIPQRIVFEIAGLEKDDASTRAAIQASLEEMMKRRAKPGSGIWLSWASEAISRAAGEDRHSLRIFNNVAESPGHLPVIGSIVYVSEPNYPTNY